MSEKSILSGFHALDTWINHDWSNGLQLESVADLTEIHVETRNSLYEITVIDGLQREIVIRGGRFFSEKTPACLAGCSLGGGFLKVGGIYAGFNLELLSGGNTIITSPVRTIRVFSNDRQILSV